MSNSFYPTMDVFHFLTDRLEITPESRELQKKFEQYDKEHPDGYYLQEMEDFAEQEKDEGSESYSDNSFNGENPLSQVIQYVSFQKDGKNFVILQIHGGADIRGGYTAPHIFETEDMFNLSDYSISASVKGKSWYSDDCGYHWAFDGTWSSDPKWLANPDVAESGIPSTWEVTKEGVFYKPTGEPISFSPDYVQKDNAPQWWHSDPRLVARFAPTVDKRQFTLNKKRLRA